MNWVFETYSNVYGAAMMQTKSAEHNAATAKEGPMPSGTRFSDFSAAAKRNDFQRLRLMWPGPLPQPQPPRRAAGLPGLTQSEV